MNIHYQRWKLDSEQEEEERKRNEGNVRTEKKRKGKKGKMRRERSGWLVLEFWMLEWEMVGVEQ